MYRLLQGMMGDFSYFLERFFNINSILWTILFMSFIFALFIVGIIKLIKLTKIKTYKYVSFTFFGISASLLTLKINDLILNTELWNSKLIRVMKNVNYILSFKAYQKSFFDSLNLPNNNHNISNLFNITKYLNKDQWEHIIENTGETSWYFAKVKQAILDSLEMGNCNLALNIKSQSFIAYIPLILICMIIILLLWDYKYFLLISIPFIIVTLSNYTLGTNIFLCFLFIFSYILYHFSKLKIDIKPKQKSQLEKYFETFSS